MNRMLSAVKFLVFLLPLLLLADPSSAQQMKRTGTRPGQARIGPPPAALDALYPPAAPEPVYLVRMIELAAPMTGIVVNIMENDLPNARASYERFVSEYRAVSALVPAWKNKFPLKPVEDLGAAVASGDPGKIMSSLQNVNGVCHNCHLRTMVPVQQKYHWPAFSPITVHDPVTQAKADYSQFMQYLDASFTGIGISLQEGQPDNARKYFQGFRARFDALGGMCVECHDTERTYYVGERAEAMLDSLGAALNSSPLDPGRIQALGMAIGMETCHKCHLVHVPAAAAQALRKGAK